MKIVVRTPNWIGDTVLALPAIESLKRNFPQAQIWMATTERIQDLFASYDLVEGVMTLPALNDLRSLKDSAQKLKEMDFEIGLLLPNSFSSAILFYLAKIPERWGYQSDGRGLLLTKGVPIKEEETCHQVYYYLNLISALGLKTSQSEIHLPLSLPEKESARKKLLSLSLDLSKPLIILNPGAFYGPSKRWPAAKFAELATLFQNRKAAEIIIVGSSDEFDLGEQVASFMQKKPVNLMGKTTLRELLSLISQSALFITNDSGPMHMANALKVPVVAIFGPTDPKTTGPFQQPSIIIRKDVACWPCSYRKCPYDHRCMMRVSPEEVFEVSQKFLG